MQFSFKNNHLTQDIMSQFLRIQLKDDFIYDNCINDCIYLLMKIRNKIVLKT